MREIFSVSKNAKELFEYKAIYKTPGESYASQSLLSIDIDI